ncbi:hypothetical protein R3W88_019284 [Solanum pinnatisectum]|uniref:Uncharacterized protein n=1 Tax=Solanum pinnatisectum TaxID=50273 RepID=A0AAV9KJ35_9SOLN|nr:hypothetical protein R3W88_019284 [Solanum pinnatisectum]
MILRSRDSTGPSIPASLSLTPSLVSLRLIYCSSNSSKGRRSIVEGNEIETHAVKETLKDRVTQLDGKIDHLHR